MRRQHRESGAALIMLIGMTGALAILTAALVMLLANQQGATAASRQAKTSLDFAEAALDSGINAIKITTQAGSNFPTVSPGVDMTSMNVQYAAACPSPAPTATYNVYDNGNTGTDVNTNIHWDANLDHKLWVEAVVTFKGHTSRLRRMLDSSTQSAVLPMAAMYADTTIVLNETSNAYAVKPDGTFVPSGQTQYAYNIMAGGSYTNNNTTVVTGNNGTTLRPPSGPGQSLGLKVNGRVSLPGVAENGVVTGGVTLLSDYFDQGRQYALTTEAQLGMSMALHPDITVPSVPGTTMTAAQRTTIQGTAPQTYTAPSDFYYNGDLTLTAASGSSTFNFRALYLTGSLVVSGNVQVNATSIYVGKSFRASGATTSSPVTTTSGPLYVAYGGASISGVVPLAFATGVHTGGGCVQSVRVSNQGSNYTSAPTVAFSGGGGSGAAATATVSGGRVTGVTITNPGSGYTSSPSVSFSGGGGRSAAATATICNLSITGPTSTGTTVADNLGPVYTTGTFAVSGNAVVDATAVYTGANFAISGNTASFTDQLGPVYVTGTADWNSGSTSGTRLGIQTTTQANPTTANPMFAQFLTIDGDTDGNYDNNAGPYDVVLGDVWVDGNAGTGDVAVNFSAPSSGIASTIMCPLLATTEKTCTNGYVNMGTLTDPMVYYMQCDNDQLYSNTCEWASSGTFTGIALIMESDIEVTGGNNGASWQTANFVGSLMAGCPITPDITMSSNSSVCYNQSVIENLPANLQSILRTTTTTTVPGTWQQLGQ